MRVVRDREDARWLPSRFHFALFRLGAFVRLKLSAPKPRKGIILILDRHQSAFENYAVTIWILATLTCFIAAELPLILSFFLALLAVQIAVVAVGLIVRNARASSIAMMLLMVLAAAYYARAVTWVRFAAWQFLGFVALNALAAVVMFALRGAVARSEATFAA